MKVLVTGGAGFIGSALIRYIIGYTNDSVVNIDKLTYAGDLASLTSVESNSRYAFEQVDICDRNALERVFQEYLPDVVMHLAAESHVDRSIGGPAAFVETNIVGTFTLLEVAREYWSGLAGGAKSAFRFHHISTDEVFGDLDAEGDPSKERSPYLPSSPYSASKASSDHFVRAWHRTYGLPVVLSNCSNNFGPYQHPEKLIPLMINNALEGKALPVYGNGLQIRDWLFVDDHVQALYAILTKGRVGETYNVGASNEKSNIEVVTEICDVLEVLVSDKPKGIEKYQDLITHVTDRPGHDKRYAIDASKLTLELGWKPTVSFSDGLNKTVAYYLSTRCP